MRKTLGRALIVGAATIASLAVASGASGAVLNTGFEALTGADPVHFSGGILIDGHRASLANPLADALVYVTPDPAPGWVVDTEAGGTMNPTEAYMPGEALDGEYVGWSNGALIYQILADDIQPSTRYTFSVTIGRPTVSADAFAYRLIMESQGLVKIQDYNSMPIGVGQWETVEMTWDSPAVVPAGAKLTINMAADAGVALFDDVDVSSGPGIPEPTVGLMAVAPVLAGMARRRRR